ncbi:MAG: ribonuclease R [Terrisporobacter sp.]|uniref:ribonuclease R n=1 Tax=Terrisporobacter sp. TaxID=1965305 RepID=UPI002A83D183|nr:ribonuclease R [Terrisporobacter sp.]MCI5629634.1 ribonuclease R [Clostridium sp.]MCI6457632.1 ribonuclease R [Clostridium sp.]MCI7206134.1 ribonuclease R [Clostridium sp.]MDY4736085.1 ribonuclease R [Terrisporobacter sp.]MDY6152520.1 ribonuclease R [Terrisporobacter sp.]
MTEKLREQLLGLINDPHYNPLKREELALIFNIHPSEMPMFYNFLDELEEDGYIVKTKKGRVMSPNQMGLFVGKFVSHRKGFGFVESDEELVQDLFIPKNDINGALHNDRVMAEIVTPATEDRRAEGKVIKIIKREVTRVVGLFQENKSFGFVVPDDKKFNQDIFIPKRYISGAKNDDKVVCEITVWPQENRKPEGKIVEILGKKGERGVEIDSIIRAHGLPEEFPKKVIDEANFVAGQELEDEIARRLDLRDLDIFTIDGEDAKDLDDAISIEVLPNGNYKLGVHIADVTHYVKEKSKLDKEALKRATSVYLVDKVIPMLPKQLSNGVCSLNPFEDKLTLSCIMEIDAEGKVVKYDIAETVINSKARMTYTEVSDILEKDDEKLKKTFAKQVDDFIAAEKLARILMKRRQRRGAIDFDFPEAKIILNKNGEVVDIKHYERRISNKMIEEFMLVANETVAEHFFWLQLPFVYRIHETPSVEKMEDLNKFMATFGYHIKGNLEDVHPKEMQSIIEKIKGTKEEESISTIMLRSMKQAKYSPSCIGHFGLAAKYYCHFTSPIRRYPDLQIHRIIKEQLNNKLNNKRQDQLAHIVEYASTQSSERERAAELAERDVHDYYKACYMADKVGQQFDGVVSGVTSFGIFVELENTVEGLIRLANMRDDYYIYNQETYSIIGERSKKTFRIGDSVRIEVDNVNVDFKEIDFKLIEKLEDNHLEEELQS